MVTDKSRLPCYLSWRNSIELATTSLARPVSANLVSDPDPRKIEKESLVNGAGWNCTLRNVRNFINC